MTTTSKTPSLRTFYNFYIYSHFFLYFPSHSGTKCHFTLGQKLFSLLNKTHPTYLAYKFVPLCHYGSESHSHILTIVFTHSHLNFTEKTRSLDSCDCNTLAELVNIHLITVYNHIHLQVAKTNTFINIAKYTAFLFHIKTRGQKYIKIM